MKKVSLKILLALLCIVLSVTLFAVFTSAEEEKCIVNLIDDGEVIETVLVDKGSSYALPQKDCDTGTYQGWFTNDGVFYPAGSSVTVNNDISLNLAKGGSASLTGSFTNAINRGYSYIKVNSSMTFSSSFTLGNTLLYIDLGGNTIKIESSENAFSGENSGIIFANGKLEYTYTGTDASHMVNSLVCLTPQASTSNLTFTVTNDCELVSNVGLIIVEKDISKLDGIEINIYGSIKSDRLLRTYGMKNGVINFFDGSSYETDCEYFYDDYGVDTDDLIATTTIHGGSFTLDTTTGFSKDENRYKTIIVDGSKPTFSKDITSFFTAKNYSFTKVDDIYEFSKCAHDGPVTVKPSVSSCTEPVTVTHTCSYCNAIYTEDLANGIGHSYTISLVNDIINTPEETKAGCYAYTCQSCGYEYNKYIYPDPSTVYVTVGIINKKGEKEFTRVPSLDLYTLEGSKLMSFSTAFIEYDLGVTQDDIFYIEVPLGTTDVYGDYRNSTETGAFRKNSFIKELELPRSLINVSKYAFSLMEKLETIHGLEYITGKIDTEAFAQADNSPLVIEHMVLNAETISERAFQNIRMKTLKFGANVKTIGNGAFNLVSHTTMLKEIFVEGYTLEDGVAATHAFNSVLRKSLNGSNQQFANMNIVYKDHDYVLTSSPATCSQVGFEIETCSRCQDTIILSEVSMLPHKYADEHTHLTGKTCAHCNYVPSSCRVRGYYAPVCEECGYEDLENKTILAFDYSSHVYTNSEKIFCDGWICENSYYTLGVCVCGKVEEDVWANRIYHDPLSNVGLHDWDTVNTVVTIEPTCSKEHGYGQEIQTCKLCGKTKKVALQPTGRHNFGEMTIIDPGTCKTQGVAVRTCSVCGDTRETLIDGAHVKEGEGEVLLEPTETSRGQIRYFCAICQTEIIEETERLPISNTSETPAWVIVLIVIGSLFLVACIILTLYFTFFKKKNASTGFKYKFNTLK